MSLNHYRRPRLVILSPRASAYDAVRAMAENHIGTVLVGEGQEITGIVTDRDLAMEIIGGDLEARSTVLSDVMSQEVVTIDVNASVADAVQKMRAHACRRLPILEDGTPVGMVTLDDLLLDGDIDMSATRAILIAQLEGPFPAGAPMRADVEDLRERARMRRKARAEGTMHRLLHAAMRNTGLDDRRKAEQALEIVLGAVCRRLTPDEARHFMAQMPSMLQAMLSGCLDGPDKRISIHSIEVELARELGLSGARASEVLYGLCEAVSDAVSAGAVEAVRSQLPAEMKDLFPLVPYRRAV